MILSFHPIIEADQNIICAGRNPGKTELEAIKKADAVILPQGCRQSLYEMASANCSHIFPNYNARFKYPEKIGQIRLFNKYNLRHPTTELFESIHNFYIQAPFPKDYSSFDYPFVFKFNWGGEGDNVFLIQSVDDLSNTLTKASVFEKTGQCGFLIQEFIPTANRSLRVVVIGKDRTAYWRKNTDPKHFGTAISKGAVLDYDSDPDKIESGIEMVNLLCTMTGINLAGIDLIFADKDDSNPLLLEINYFFGRTGIGGSDQYYKLLKKAVDDFIANL
jgi:ribosomal protein S6--L-glutamate ligase